MIVYILWDSRKGATMQTGAAGRKAAVPADKESMVVSTKSGREQDKFLPLGHTLKPKLFHEVRNN